MPSLPVLAAPERSGAKISYIWDVTDAKGTRVTRVSGEEVVAKGSASDPWSGVDATVIRSIANKTSSQLAANLPGGGGGVLQQLKPDVIG